MNTLLISQSDELQLFIKLTALEDVLQSYTRWGKFTPLLNFAIKNINTIITVLVCRHTYWCKWRPLSEETVSSSSSRWKLSLFSISHLLHVFPSYSHSLPRSPLRMLSSHVACLCTCSCGLVFCRFTQETYAWCRVNGLILPPRLSHRLSCVSVSMTSAHMELNAAYSPKHLLCKPLTPRYESVKWKGRGIWVLLCIC